MWANPYDYIDELGNTEKCCGCNRPVDTRQVGEWVVEEVEESIDERGFVVYCPSCRWQVEEKGYIE